MKDPFLSLEQAIAGIQDGDVVAIPTETVYGLAADATCDKAVAKIYAYKHRPLFNPLIVHFKSRMHAQDFVEFSPMAQKLAEKFWPGPLTLVLPMKNSPGISHLCSAGLSTLGVRIPHHPLTQKLLDALTVPVAAPSANPSARLSATSAADVRKGFHPQSLPILDGGPCAQGLESTILDASVSPPRLLRPGALSVEILETVLEYPLERSFDNPQRPKSPGSLLKHYAPCKPLRMDVLDPYPHEIYITFGPVHSSHTSCVSLSLTGDLQEAAASFFRVLHEAETLPGEGIAVAPLPQEGVGYALNDRLIRASRA